MDYKHKKVTIIGLGITGFYTAKFFISKGANIFVNDIKSESKIKKIYIEELKKSGVDIQTGKYNEKKIMNSDIIVISPGVPTHIEILQKAKKAEIPIIGELELAYRMMRKSILVAITGTNGKSTVTSLIGHILRLANKKIFVGGNIGMPFISCLVNQDKPDICILEVSSFQLDTIDKFCPFISIILNITPDHMDRYKSFQEYVKSKFKIFSNQKKGNYLIIDQEDNILSSIMPSNGVEVLRYGINHNKNINAFFKNGVIHVSFGKKKAEFSLENVKLIGLHNIKNIMASILCCLILGVDKYIIQNAIEKFKGLPHRLEYVLEKNGILFIDDSKATNLDATKKAVNAINRPIILIAGGKDKGLDYKQLVYSVKNKVKHAIFIGETSYKLLNNFRDKISCDLANDMFDAVLKAYKIANKGDSILLSPACSSFDMFNDYSHRGKVFQEAVRKILNA